MVFWILTQRCMLLLPNILHGLSDFTIHTFACLCSHVNIFLQVCETSADTPTLVIIKFQVTGAHCQTDLIHRLGNTPEC